VYEPEGAESHKHLDGSVVEINSTPFTEEQESKERTDSNRVNGGRDGGRCEEAAVRFMVWLVSLLHGVGLTDINTVLLLLLIEKSSF
jgi:hypothetical protein